MTLFKTNLIGSVKKFAYAKNHHYLELEDHAGNGTTLLERGLIAYTCTACDYRWWSESNLSTCCPSCRGTEITQVWSKPQVALIPENESGFELIKKDED